jgi:simple sugar transport system permease protein
MLERMSEALATNLNPVGVGIMLAVGGGAAYLYQKKHKEFWPLLGLFALLSFNFVCSNNFLVVELRDGALFGTPLTILNQGSEVMLLGIGMTLVIAVKGIDLSVGPVMALAGATCVMSMKGGSPFYLAALFGLMAATTVGVFNGGLITGLKVQPIVATLITMVAVRGVATLTTGAVPVGHDDPAFARIGNGHFLGMFVSVWVVAVVFVTAALLVRRTALGLFMESIGDNERASRLAGVPSRSIKLSLYGFSGFCAGVAGLIAASYIHTADPDRIGRMRELDAIFATVIGGTALTGGRFTLAGTLIGAVLIQTLSITMYSQNVPSDIEPMPKAVVILLVCLLLSPDSRAQVLRLLKNKPRIANRASS